MIDLRLTEFRKDVIDPLESIIFISFTDAWVETCPWMAIRQRFVMHSCDPSI